jgi:hypothetical protein
MTTKALYPNIAPSLSLDFANTKALDPRITFARASTGRYYDGKTTAKAEENLLIRSQEFDNASWVKSNVTITANDAVAPDGSSTADRAVATAGTYHTRYAHLQGVSPTFSSPTWFVLSFWIKSATGSNQNLSLEFVRQGTGYLNFAVEATPTWQRFVYAVEVASSGTRLDAGIANSAAGDAFDVHLWGAQLEQRSAVTAYTPTTTQPITNYVPVLQSAANNVARFDHNPVTGESLGLLIEEQRVNTMLYSSDFTQQWQPLASGTVRSNVTVAPDGTLTADEFVSGGANSILIQYAGGFSAGAVVTWSIYLKRGNTDWTFVRVSRSDGSLYGEFGSYFNLANGTVGSTAISGTATLVSKSITPVGNGWYRCTVVGNTTAATTYSPYITASLADGGGTTTGLTVLCWGAQLEAGAFPTSYIPTVASQVTRSADAASMTGANFSSWFSNAEGTFYTDYNVFGADGGSFALTTGSGRVGIRVSTGAPSGYNRLNGNLDIGAVQATGGNHKIAYALQSQNTAISDNGATASTSSASFALGETNLFIGTLGVSATDVLNGHLRKIAYYPLRLSNAQLQALTQN